jgi:hypothetical protein
MAVLKMGLGNYLSWPQTLILPISVSQVASITDVNHQHPAKLVNFRTEKKLLSDFVLEMETQR